MTEINESRYIHILNMSEIIKNIGDDDCYYDWKSVTGAEDAFMVTPREMFRIANDESMFKACEKMFHRICRQRRLEILRKALAA